MNEAKNWARITEGYDEGFTEVYLDLYKTGGSFVIRGTAYNYNAGMEKKLWEKVKAQKEEAAQARPAPKTAAPAANTEAPAAPAAPAAAPAKSRSSRSSAAAKTNIDIAVDD